MITTLHEYLKINESSFFDIKYDDVDKIVKNLIKTETDYINNELESYINDEDLDDDDKDKILKSPEFLDVIENKLYTNYNDFHINVFDKINQFNNIIIYRMITVDDDWLHHLKVQGKRLGIYWTWDENYAEAYGGDYNKKNMALITAEINEKYIDWLTTISMNIHPYFCEEREIRLFKNTPLNIKSININNQDIDLSIFKNKVFYS
jgi:hypothetical protein